MSKKKFKKFKTGKKETPIVRAQGVEGEMIDQTEGGATVVKETVANDPYQTEHYAYVRHDIKKILLIILAALILLTGAYFISTKTTIFTTFGDWMYKILNIQTS